MDINQLLASEQLSLLLAQFASSPAARHRYLAVAASQTESLSWSVYPYRPFTIGTLA